MDVRCEKCQTVYEFDEAQVGEQGVTVKCTQCGNLFKVKRRSTTAEMAYGAATRPPKTTHRGLAVDPVASGNAPAQPAPPRASRADGEWMLRRASNGKVFRFREIASLRQLVLEGKLVREDEVSQDGEEWQMLGALPELKQDFIAVTTRGPQAPGAAANGNNAPPPKKQIKATQQNPRWQPDPRAESEPSVSSVEDERPGPSSRSGGRVRPRFDGPEGPSSMGPGPGMGVGLTLPDENEQSYNDRPAQRSSAPLYVVGAVVVLLAGGGLWWWRHSVAPAASQSLDQAATLFAADTDDAFRQATSLLQQMGSDGSEQVATLSLLADIEATWAFHLREDARGLEAAGGAAAMAGRTLRTEADVHLADAKRAANQAMSVGPNTLEANRAMADVLMVQGAAASEVEQALKKALDLKPQDPASVYIGGALSYREGRSDDARLRLNQANQLNLAAVQKPLIRALFLDGTILAALGRAPEARQSLNAVLSASPQHERARTLLQLLEAAAAKTAPVNPTVSVAPVAAPTGPLAAPTAPVVVPANPTAPTTAGTPSGGAGAGGSGEPAGDYGHLVAAADRAAENGHSDQARKTYERALTINPRGVEAITGLGYCDLDQEHFMAAVDRFRRALEISPEHGEALIGMAEAYKVRGDKAQALDYYKRYLRAQPGGSKSDMAQKNIRDLEPHSAVTTQTTTPIDDKGQATGPTTTVQTGGDRPTPPAPPAEDKKPPAAEAKEPANAEPSKPEAAKPEPTGETALPHLPAN